MNSFISMPPERRKLVCDQTAAQIGLSAHAIEKDYWVSWTLRELFRLPQWGTHLIFKGGTSLSKGWKLIERFSEDIDIVIDRDALGFAGTEAPDKASNKSQIRKRLDALKSACQSCVQGDIQNTLSGIIEKSIPGSLEWSLDLDTNDNDGQTLMFKYPTVYPDPTAYLPRRVKIEMGARSDTDPSEEIFIRPMVAEAFPDVFPDSAFLVRALSPMRTFWEKAMLLHEEAHRPLDKKRIKKGMARHYYDLSRLIRQGIGAKAAQDLDLFRRIAEHRQIYFNWSWLDYATLAPGKLQLVPPAHYIADWRADYNDMQGEMFYGTVPEFDEVLQRIEAFQDNFNGEGVAL